MYGQISDKDGLKVIAVDDDSRYHQTFKRGTGLQEISSIDQDVLEKYSRIRENLFENRSEGIRYSN